MAKEVVSRRARRRQVVREALEQRDWEGLWELSRRERGVGNLVYSFLSSDDRLLAWRAIEALGELETRRPSSERGSTRDLIRRLFWSMNDESGNLVRQAPEAIGQLLYRIPELIDEYGVMLLSFLAEEPFERGAHWAVARVAERRPDIYASSASLLARSLHDPDPSIRAFAFLALRQLPSDPLSQQQENSLLEEDSPLEIYHFDTGDFIQTRFHQVFVSGSSLLS